MPSLHYTLSRTYSDTLVLVVLVLPTVCNCLFQKPNESNTPQKGV